MQSDHAWLSQAARRRGLQEEDEPSGSPPYNLGFVSNFITFLIHSEGRLVY